jgi:uracil-DNA glycosylase family 4
LKPSPDCRLCGLWSGRTQIVMPCGDPASGIVFVGEAPGESEDLRGMPFVGKSGKILDGMMAEEGFGRSEIMITNTVKCRPPGNRDPTDGEMAACRPFLHSELESCRLVIGLGKSACRALMGFEGRMSDIVNTETEISVNGKTIRFIPTYHPAACIYRKEAREELRKTLRKVREELGIH